MLVMFYYLWRDTRYSPVLMNSCIRNEFLGAKVWWDSYSLQTSKGPHFQFRNTKGDYLSLVDIKSYSSRDCRLVTSLHSLTKVVSQSATRSQTEYLLFFFLTRNLLTPNTCFILHAYGFVFPWKYIFTRYRKSLQLIVLIFGGKYCTGLFLFAEYILANDIVDESGLLEGVILKMASPEKENFWQLQFPSRMIICNTLFSFTFHSDCCVDMCYSFSLWDTCNMYNFG